MIVGATSAGRKDTCRDEDISLAPGVGFVSLCTCQNHQLLGQGSLTCEDWRFEELDKLIDLDEHVDRHFEVGTGVVSMYATNMILPTETYNIWRR